MMDPAKKKYIAILIIVVVIVLVLIGIFLIYKMMSKESFMSPDYGVNRFLKTDSSNCSKGSTILTNLFYNTKYLYDLINVGSYPNFANIYGIFNEYKIAIKNCPNKTYKGVDQVVDDMMLYLKDHPNDFNDGYTEEWYVLKRKLVNMNKIFAAYQNSAYLTKDESKKSQDIVDETMINTIGTDSIKDTQNYFESVLDQSPKDEGSIAETLIESLNNVNIQSQYPYNYSEVLANEPKVTGKDNEFHRMILQDKKNKKYRNSKGEQILPNVEFLSVNEDIDTMRYDPLKYRGDPDVYENNNELAVETGYNPDIIDSIKSKQFRLKQIQ